MLSNSPPSLQYHLDHFTVSGKHFDQILDDQVTKMTTMDCATKGKTTLFAANAVLVAFARQKGVTLDLNCTAHNSTTLDGDAILKLKMDDGALLKNFDVLRHLSKIISSASGLPPSTVGGALD